MGEIIKAQMTTVMAGFAPLTKAMDAALADADEWGQVIAELELREHLKALMAKPEVLALFDRIGNSGMVELANNPDITSIPWVVGEAIMLGLNPRYQEFGVFGGRNGGKLYIKENGYRRLINRLPGCVIGDVQVSFPVMQQLSNGQKVWSMDGIASCTFRGREVVAKREGKYAVRIPANSTDQIDAIQTKGRRRMLQELLKKTTGMMLADDSDDVGEIDTETHPVEVIEATAQPAQASQQPRYSAKKDKALTTLGRSLPEDKRPPLRELLEAIDAMTNGGDRDRLITRAADVSTALGLDADQEGVLLRAIDAKAADIGL